MRRRWAGVRRKGNHGGGGMVEQDQYGSAGSAGGGRRPLWAVWPKRPNRLVDRLGQN
jgi:hypothetical protein